jgi:hypothetical protein
MYAEGMSEKLGRFCVIHLLLYSCRDRPTLKGTVIGVVCLGYSRPTLKVYTVALCIITSFFFVLPQPLLDHECRPRGSANFRLNTKQLF